jgi:hypothetical protein
VKASSGNLDDHEGKDKEALAALTSREAHPKSGA